MKSSRRTFLKYAGGGAALSALPLSVQQVLAAPAAGRGNFGSLAHVVILSQENRSFDHYLGTLNGVRGFNDPHPLRLPDGRSVFAQRDGNGRVVWPFRLNNKTTNGQCMVDVAHSWGDGLQAFNGGRMDQWLPAKGQYGMTYFRREDLQFHYALSDAFTTCDHFFCSANTSTDPNRLYLMTGTNGSGLWPRGAVMDNDTSVPFTWTTYAERLEAAGVSWKMYQEQDNYDDNALAWFAQFQRAPANSPLYQRGMVRLTRDAFAKDVAADRLPAVSWIIAPAALSEHPAWSPADGAAYAEIFLDALASNPVVWAKTLFIYTYDENGGIYDHVVPPVAPPGTPGETKDGRVIGLGHRMPTWLISPWSVGGWVYSQTCDLTSVVRFLERWTGVQEPNIGAWRRSICGDLVDGLDFNTAGQNFPTTLPDAAALARQAEWACRNLPSAQPGGEVSAPAVEAGGSRPLRPVAVQPVVNAVVPAGSREVRLQLSNAGSQSAVFDVHGYGESLFAPVFLTVDPNTSQTRGFSGASAPNGRYDIAVHGPNSFYRRFAGRYGSNVWQGGPFPAVTVTPNPAGGYVTVVVTHTGTSNATMYVNDYMAGKQTAQTLYAGYIMTFYVSTLNNWYDFKLFLSGDNTAEFSYEYCGHIEGGMSMTFPGQREIVGGVIPGFTPALLQGMTHYYGLEGTAADAVGTAALSLVGPVEWLSGGRFGRALQLDAMKAAAAFLPAELARNTSSFTLGFWVKLPASIGSGWSSVATNKDWATGMNPGFSIGYSGDGRFKFNVGDGSRRADGFLPALLGAWTYVAIAVDLSRKEMRCYTATTSGNLMETEVNFANVTGSVVPSYGRWAFNEDARGDYYRRHPSERFTLGFDDIASWSRLLGREELNAIAIAGRPLSSLRSAMTMESLEAADLMPVTE